MGERVPFNPRRTCECPLFRQGYAGFIIHRSPCEKKGLEQLAQSGDSIVPGKQYRWITGDDEWSRGRGRPEFNVVALVTRVTKAGMVFAYWHHEQLDSDQRDLETCIPHSAVVELVG